MVMCPIYNGGCNKETCGIYDDANKCCSIKSIADSLCLIAATIRDNRTSELMKNNK